MADLQQLEGLLEASSLPLVRLCGDIVARVAGRLKGERDQLDHRAIKHDLKTASLLFSLGGEKNADRGEVARELMQRVCLPYLNILFQDSTASLEGVQAVADTVVRILQDRHLPADVAVWVLKDGVCPLLVGEGLDSAESLSFLTTFLNGVFSRASPESLELIPGCADHLLAMFPLLLTLLDHCSTSTCHLLLSSILPSFITSSHNLSAVWTVLKDVWYGQRLMELHPLIFSLALLCCFSDVLIARDHTSPFAVGFPPSVLGLCPLLDIRAEGILWGILGAGLRSNDPLDRKRSMYILDRVLCSVRSEGGGDVMSEGGVFWWKREYEDVLSTVWEDLVLLLHTMEEKQLHIVKPVKSRMKSIIQATSTYIDGCSVLHVSWLALALERVFVHTEAKSIVHWGVSEALSLDLASSPFLLPPHWQFVLGPLLNALSETKLYTKDHQATVCPPMATLLTSFLQNFVSHLTLPLKGKFVHNLLVAVEATNMPETPLLYMTHSLSLLPPAPLLGPPSLFVLRSIISRLDTVRALIRAAIASFLLTTAANLSDMPLVGYYEVAMVIESVKVAECLLFSSPMWCQMCQWLSAVCAASDVSLSSFLTDSLASLLKGETQSQGLGPTPLSTLLLLAVDAQFSGQQCLPVSSSLEELLSSLLLPLTSVLSTASSRPYLPQHSLITSLQTITALLTTILSGHSLSSTNEAELEMGKILYKCMLPWLPEMMQNLHELLLKGSKDETGTSLPHIILLTSSLSTLYTFTKLYGFSWSSASPTHLASLAVEALMSTLHGDEVTVLTPAVMGALSALGWVCREDITLPPHTLSLLLSLPLSLNLTRPKPVRMLEQGYVMEHMEWGPVMDWCETAHWTVLRYSLYHLYNGENHDALAVGEPQLIRCDASAVWVTCTNSVGIVATPQLPLVLDSLSILLPHVELSVVPDTVQCCWRAVRTCLPALPSFLSLLLHSNLLFNPDSDIVQLVKEICQELMVLGERRTGVVNVMATTLCEGWWREWAGGRKERVMESMLRHQTLLIQLCCFSSVNLKSMRSLVDSEQFVQSLGDQIAANCKTTSDSVQQGDSGVRVTVLTFLVQVVSTDKHVHFLPQLSIVITNKLSELSASKPRYFINSLTHRLKQRLLQTLLLLLPHLPPDGVNHLAPEILKALQSDNQTSVRHLLEWTIVLLLARQRHLISTLLLPAVQPDSEFRLSRLPSLLTVCMHLSTVGSTEERARYCHTLLPVIFPWTSCHHFVVRLYAQQTVVVLWAAGNCEGEDTLIDNCIPFLKTHSDAARFQHKLSQNVFFSLIRPLSDLSMEVLFDLLPRLCGVANDESISATDFRQAWQRWGEGGRDRVPLYCDNNLLHDAVGKKNEVEEVRGDDTRSIAHQFGVKCNEEWVGTGDVQKKITRWVSGAGVLDELFPRSSTPSDVGSGRQSSGLILVASLLNKIPNLGGLCRTCEIFGVCELVLPNLAVVEDPQFTALSVSAQHWLKISEVRLPQLPSYLLAMHNAGYQLVGAEQTAQSKCVTSFEFQPRTVLLLGNEREGIPVQLLHLLQGCVQIPQLGVVRSLNAHVSGALLVWEYCKQHLLSHHLPH